MIRRYKIVFLLLLLLTLFTLTACAMIGTNSEYADLENDIKDLILAKGSDYDYANDQNYMTQMDELVNSLINEEEINREHFTIGDLDNDNIPEVAIFRERDPKDSDDQGKLEIYKFTGDKYSLLDSVDMNYDNTNYDMAIGNISKDQKGIYINNQVGAHAGMTYGYILEDGKLKSILNRKKINLLSAYTSNPITDIDGDGILNFSIYMLDPESDNTDILNTDKLLLWYKWDGNDSAELVEVEQHPSRGTYSREISDLDILAKLDTILAEDYPSFLNFSKENRKYISKRDNTIALKKYISILENSLEDVNSKLNNIDNSLLYDNPSILNNISNLDFLLSNKEIQNIPNLYDLILKNKNLGYKLQVNDDNQISFVVNFDYFYEEYKSYISKEAEDYLNIIVKYNNLNKLSDDYFNDLSELIVMIEHFKNIYPYSEYIDEVQDMYSITLKSYMYGSEFNSNFNENTNVINDKILKHFYKTIEDYEFTNFANIIEIYISFLKDNSYKINNTVKEQMRIVVK